MRLAPRDEASPAMGSPRKSILVMAVLAARRLEPDSQGLASLGWAIARPSIGDQVGRIFRVTAMRCDRPPPLHFRVVAAPPWVKPAPSQRRDLAPLPSRVPLALVPSSPPPVDRATTVDCGTINSTPPPRRPPDSASTTVNLNPCDRPPERVPYRNRSRPHPPISADAPSAPSPIPPDDRIRFP